jgi:tetratricopeptide (TPR) repeat protein
LFCLVMEEEQRYLKDRNSLDKAHQLKSQANDEYQKQNNSAAVRLYHECLLHAKAISQLSTTNLQSLARMEAEKGDSKEKLPKPSVSGGGDTKLNAEASISGSRSRIDSTTRGEEMKEEAKTLIAKCYNNLAACILNGPPRKSDDYLRAASYCDNVLAVEGDNEKAFYRKGCALMKAEKYDPAIECFLKCPKNVQAEKHILECKQKLSEERKRRDDQIRANFAKARAAEEQRNHQNGAVADGAANGNAQNGNVPH